MNTARLVYERVLRNAELADESERTARSEELRRSLEGEKTRTSRSSRTTRQVSLEEFAGRAYTHANLVEFVSNNRAQLQATPDSPHETGLDKPNFHPALVWNDALSCWQMSGILDIPAPAGKRWVISPEGSPAGVTCVPEQETHEFPYPLALRAKLLVFLAMRFARKCDELVKSLGSASVGDDDIASIAENDWIDFTGRSILAQGRRFSTYAKEQISPDQIGGKTPYPMKPGDGASWFPPSVRNASVQAGWDLGF